MAHREYRDSHGLEWQVWEVIPHAAERRKARILGSVPRRGPERRVRNEVRLSSHIAESDRWLVFESRDQKRRLRPVPADWHLASADELESMCARADHALRPTPRLIE